MFRKLFFILFVIAVAWFVRFSQTGKAIVFHTVPEGHVGVYNRFGAIVPTVTAPGLHFSNPLTTTVDFIQVTLQTDTVRNIPCGTSAGVTITFDKIEVVNRLDKGHVFKTVRDYGVNYDKVWIFDKIHHEINQFCSSHTLHEVYIDKFADLDESLAAALQESCDQYDTGIDIIAIRVTKPRIPSKILKEFEEVEAQKANLLVLQQKRALSMREEETKMKKQKIEAEKERTIAKINAEKLADVSRINENKKTAATEAEAERQKMVARIKEEQMILEKKGQAERARIDIALKEEKELLEMNLIHERQQKELEIQQEQLTPEYLTLRHHQLVSKALGDTPKIYFGKSLPDLMDSLIPREKNN